MIFLKKLLIPLTYFLLTILFTFPLALNMHSKVTDLGDPLFISWVVNSGIRDIKEGDFAGYWDQNIFYPYENTLAFSDHSIALTLQGLPVSFLTSNPIFIVNFVQMLGIFLSALFAYYLGLYYTNNKKAAFVVGLVYGFAPYHIGQISHIQVASYQFIPLTILFFERLLKEPGWKYALGFAAAFVLNAFVSIYHLGFIIIPLVLILLVRLFSKEISLKNLKLYIWGGASVLLSSVVMLPFLLPYMEVSKNFNVVRQVEELLPNSANLVDFAVAPQNHLFLGWLTQRIYATNPANFWSEHTLFLGIFVPLFALLSIFAYRRKTSQSFAFPAIELTSTKVIYTILIVVSLILTFGPYIGLERRFPLPFLFLFEYIYIYKAIRVPTRVMVVGLLGLAVLVGFFVKKVDEDSSWNIRKKNLAVLGIVGLIILESLSLPVKLYEVKPINRELYTWIEQNTTKEDAVLHFTPNNIPVELGTLVADRRVFNGYSGIMPESTFRVSQMYDQKFLENPIPSLEIIATIGIDLLVVHKNEFADQVYINDVINTFARVDKLSKVREFGSDVVYDIKHFNNESLKDTSTSIKAEIFEEKLRLIHRNDSDTTWVSDGVESYDLKYSFWKDGKEISSKHTSLYKPLFLRSEEEIVNIVDLKTPLFADYDEVKVEVR